ncbi:hypothetical protein PPERSA_04506 [Pseudocohnilembus persalinus]|uniref:Uncharacterized protein n=1 Tax=Pseudocohnilembus persalinus TaxID=266149 RepID=A0A0V0QTH8_PSEPJ|nr:hypothetical protein PPERSA_04506 [Pseudocohnilembus persalinus]|eukprot:KRX05469.1 hypothetical protein PPERSA_04506 [Pseudocohnilembus persalinus]
MSSNSLMQCKKEGHQNLKFLYLNMSSENKENLFLCPVCVQQMFNNQEEIPQINKQNLIIKQLKNEQIKTENLIGWPPIKNKNHQKIYQTHQQFIKEFGLKNENFFNYFQRKINDFYQNLENQIKIEIQILQKETIIQLEDYCNNYYQNQNPNQIYQNIQEIIKLFDVKDLRQKFQEYQQENIELNQLFDYKQQQNSRVYNNQNIYQSLQNQYKNAEELKKDLENEFNKIREPIDSIKQYLLNIKTKIKYYPYQQQLKLYKSDYNYNYNKGNFEIDNEARTIKFQINKWTCIYSENLEQENEYHLRFTMDTKNNQKNIYLAFSLTSGDQKNSKDLKTDHYVRVFNWSSNSFASGGEFQVEGRQNFHEFFKDNQTVMNLVFHIDKKLMEIYDDDRISYQRLNFSNNINNYDEWILGISYYLDLNNQQEVDIYFQNMGKQDKKGKQVKGEEKQATTQQPASEQPAKQQEKGKKKK